jgi:hypothetical protein
MQVEDGGEQQDDSAFNVPLAMAAVMDALEKEMVVVVSAIFME